jgi:hypothetical protein
LDPASSFAAGRIVERVWLAATRRGIGLQPLMSPVVHFHRVDFTAGDGMSPAERDEVRALRPGFDALFGLRAGHDVPMFLFRLLQSASPPVRSHRHPLVEVLHHDE